MGEKRRSYSKPMAVPKKAVLGGNETLLLEKTNKSSPARTGSWLRSWGAAVQRGWLSSIPVHHPSPLSQSIMTGRASRWSQPLHPQGLTCIPSTAVPGPPLWPSPPVKPPKPFRLCARGRGCNSLLGQSSGRRNPLHFGILLGTSGCFRANAESLSHETPPE